MIAALLLGRRGSSGFPGKNTMPVMGRPLSEYPMLAAENAPSIDKCYLSTDDERLMDLARGHGFEIIVRPPELCTNAALGEDAYRHGYFEIKKMNPDEEIELMVLLFCNAATINSDLIEQGIAALKADPEADSAVTVSRYNMWSPLRARRLTEAGYLDPFVPFETFGDPATLNCDRDSQGDVFYADMGTSIVRPHCLEKMDEGLLPQKWMGHKILPIYSEAGCDVDYAWQLPMVEWWVKEHGPK